MAPGESRLLVAIAHPLILHYLLSPCSTFLTMLKTAFLPKEAHPEGRRWLLHAPLARGRRSHVG